MKSVMHYLYSVSQKIEELRYRKVKCRSYIVLFHETPQQISEINDGIITISYNSFVEFITELENYGYVFADINELFQDSDDQRVFITFDDIFFSAYHNAIAYLSTKGIPFTCFIAPKLMGKEGYISDRELIDLAENPLCTIGAHSNEHLRLRDLSNKQILEDFICSKSILESRTKKAVSIMAYPYGSRSACPNRVKKLAEKAGFTLAFSTYRIPAIKTFINRNHFWIPRINVIESNFKSVLEDMKRNSDAKN